MVGQSIAAEEPALHAAVKLADDGITGLRPDRSGEAEPHTTADDPLRGNGLATAALHVERHRLPP